MMQFGQQMSFDDSFNLFGENHSDLKQNKTIPNKMESFSARSTACPGILSRSKPEVKEPAPVKMANQVAENDREFVGPAELSLTNSSFLPNFPKNQKKDQLIIASEGGCDKKGFEDFYLQF